MTANRDAIEKATNLVVEYVTVINEAIAQPAIDATLGYRNSLSMAELPSPVIDAMTTQYHGELVKVLFAQIMKTSVKK